MNREGNAWLGIIVGTPYALEYESRIPTAEAIAGTAAPVFEPRGCPLTTTRLARSRTALTGRRVNVSGRSGASPADERYSSPE